MNIDEPLQTKDQPKEQKIDDEEALVLIQFTDLDDAQYCQHFSSKFKTISIEKSSPIIQIGNRFYTGEYTNNIGTYLFFKEEDKQPELITDDDAEGHHSNDNATEPKLKNNNNSTYFGKTFKKLILNRLFIEEKPVRE